LVLQDKSPWDALTLIFTCDLTGSVSITMYCTYSFRVFTMHTYPERSRNKIIKIL
ncbi:hypothetical protein BO78DRAFT_302735, partial [Aspergillus sclerotiicarbonarius CBS 121057]